MRQEDPESYLDIKEDVREEGNKCGDVTNVVLYDEEEDGVVSIRFTEPAGAEFCAAKFNGRLFGGRTLVAYVPQHREQYRKSKAAVTLDIDDDDEIRSDDDDENIEHTERNGAVPTKEGRK